MYNVMEIKESSRKLWEQLRELDTPHYTQERLLKILLDDEDRDELAGSIADAKAMNGIDFKMESRPQRKAELLEKAYKYLEALTLVKEIDEMLTR